MSHRPWRELFERLPPKTQAEVKENTATVLADLDRAEQERSGEGQRDDKPAPARSAARGWIGGARVSSTSAT